jgi:hypothetical protein
VPAGEPVDPQQAADLYGHYADPDPVLAQMAKLNAQMMAIQAHAKHQADIEQCARLTRTTESMGMTQDAALTAVPEAMRKEVEAQLKHDDKLENLARQASLFERGGVDPEQALAAANVDPEQRREVQREIEVMRLEQATHGDVDPKVVVDELEKLDDPAHRAAVLDRYKAKTGKDLKELVHENVKGNYRDVTDQLLSDERTKAEEKLAALSPKEREEKRKWAREQARAIGNELASNGDMGVVFDKLGFHEPEDVEAIRQAYREIHPDHPSLFNDIDRRMGGKDEREAVADLDMGKDRKVKQAAAALDNAVTAHDLRLGVDPARTKEVLEKLSKEDIDKLNNQHHDLVTLAQESAHGTDREIVDAYLQGDKDLAVGRQLAEDIHGNEGSVDAHGELRGKLSANSLFAKLEKLKPEERKAAIDAYNADVKKKWIADGGKPKDAPTMESLMNDRMSGYDQLRGDALLAGDTVGAKAAQAEGALVGLGVKTEDVEAALADPDLSSTDEKTKKAAQARRADIMQRIALFGHGSLQQQLDAKGESTVMGNHVISTEDRLALDDVVKTGKVSFGVQLRRNIKGDNTEAALESFRKASDQDIKEAKKLFEEHPEWGGSMAAAVRKEWGPDVDALGVTVHVGDADASGTYYEMAAMMNHARELWSPEERARIDREVHDRDRKDPSLNEFMGKTWAGKDYDSAIRRESTAAAEGKKGEEFNFLAENSESAAKGYGDEKKRDAESFVAGLQLLAKVVSFVAPELAPVIGPLVSYASIAYKESQLGAHYEGENEDKRAALVDTGLSAFSAVAPKVLEVHAQGKLNAGLEQLERQGGAVAKGTAAAEQAAVGQAEAGAVKRAAAGQAEAGAVKQAAAGQVEKTEAEKLREEAAEKLKEASKEELERRKLMLEGGSIVAENVAKGTIVEGKSADEIVRGSVLGLAGFGASKLGGSYARAHVQGDGLGAQAAIGTTSAAASLPFDAAAAPPENSALSTFAWKAAGNTASGVHEAAKAHKEHAAGDETHHEHADAGAAQPHEEHHDPAASSAPVEQATTLHTPVVPLAQAPRAPELDKGLADRGERPEPGARSETREQYQARRSRERAEETVRNADQPLENPNPGAATEGHGHARHGYQTTDEQQAARVVTGRFPDDPYGPTDGPREPVSRASRFGSPQAEAEALGRARRELDAELARDAKARGPAPTYVDEDGVPVRMETDVRTNRPEGYGPSQVVRRTGGPGSPPAFDAAGNRQAIPDPARIDQAKVVYEYVPSTGEWRAVTYYPEQQ